MQKRFWFKSLLLAAVVLASPLAAHARARPDAWITMKAKSALYLEHDVSGSAINVDTINGRVTLHGTVHDTTEKARAAEVVNKIEGVTDVRNLLRVSPPIRNAATNTRSDARITADVAKRLKADGSLDDSDISVKSVDKGAVRLTGKASSLSDNQRALHHASSSPGVSHVTSDIVVSETFSDDDFNTDVETTRTAGGVMSDLWITSATKMKLAADSRTPATEINVDTRDGQVTLFGMVPSRDSKSAAYEIARSVSGVNRVTNRLEIVSPAKHDVVQARDDEILAGVNKTLTDRGEQENASIDVEVSNGVVRLTGTVPTWQRHLSAVYAARSVSGVRSVRNELKVEARNAAR